MILLLARALIPAALEQSSGNIREHLRCHTSHTKTSISLFIVDIRGIIFIYSVDADKFKKAEKPADEDDFWTAVNRIWHRKREDLEALSPLDAPHRDEVIELWTEFGKKCDVNVDAPYDRTSEIEEAASRFKAKRCAWRECLCFGERPQHNLKKCKGCSTALYCSAKCQKRYACLRKLLMEPSLMLTCLV